MIKLLQFFHYFQLINLVIYKSLFLFKFFAIWTVFLFSFDFYSQCNLFLYSFPLFFQYQFSLFRSLRDVPRFSRFYRAKMTEITGTQGQGEPGKRSLSRESCQFPRALALRKLSRDVSLLLEMLRVLPMTWIFVSIPKALLFAPPTIEIYLKPPHIHGYTSLI